MRHYTKEEDSILVNNYGKLPCRQILVLLNNRTISSMYNRARRLGLSDYSHRFNTTFNHDLILSDYKDGMTYSDIMLKHSCSSNTISKVTSRNNIQNRKGNFNHYYFDTIDTEEKAYWLGFITADGCVGDNNSIGIALATRDIQHLYKWLKCIESSNTVTSCTISRDNKEYYSSSVSVANEHMAETLKSYGVTPRKSLTCQVISIPEVVPYELERHYWRGLVDGDGWVGIDGRNYLNIGLKGTYSIVSGFKEFCNKFVDSIRKIQPAGNVYQIDFCTAINGILKGRKGIKYTAIDICSKLYDNSDIYLERKYNIYMSVKNNISSNMILVPKNAGSFSQVAAGGFMATP